MIRLSPLGLTCAGVAVSLLAEPALAEDARLASRMYHADEVVRIEGRTNVQATIAFGDDEHIENVAIGDSNAWQVTPNKRADVLFIKPLNARARTNLTVLTDQHSYFFDLIASPTAHPLYALRFKYSNRVKPNTSIASTVASGVMHEAAPPERQLDPATLNFAWSSKGKRSLLPSRIYDDGSSTYLTWPPGAVLPAFLVRNARGEEGPVNFSMRKDVIVIEGVPNLIVLRSGKDIATIEKQAPRRATKNARAALVAAQN